MVVVKILCHLLGQRFGGKVGMQWKLDVTIKRKQRWWRADGGKREKIDLNTYFLIP